MNRLAAPTTLGRDGRLGNQLLMVAATYAVAARQAAVPTFPADWAYRHVWPLPDEWFVPRADLADLPSVLDIDATAHLPVRWRHYLQDISLWWPLRSHVRRRLLTLTPSAAATLHAASVGLFTGLAHPVLSVHVRRGDNVTNEPGTINLLDPDYYARGAAAATARTPCRSVVVFTDDPDWCEAHADHLGCPGLPRRVYHGAPRSKETDPDYLTEPANEWVDMMLSALCGAHVLSNSTFSWWGAFLACDPTPVYPSYWVGHQLLDAGFDPGLLFPGDWVRVAAESVTPDSADPLGD